MKRRKGRKPLDKESKAEDWCFCCKDGGELLICDYKECLKAYHCKCVGKDDSFMSSGKLWSCDWHFCRSCRKASRYYCLCCPSAVCSSCAYIQDFVQIKGKYGMCTHCLKLALLIEENMNVDSDGEQVEFDSVDTLEGLFKEYYELKKGTLGLNSKVLRSAKRRLTMGRNYPSDSEADQYDEVGDNHLTSDDESMDDSEGERKSKRSKGKQSLNRQKGRSSKMEFDGWASKSLIQFLRLIGKDPIESLSEQEVTAIINDYIRHHKLSDPKMKKRILCDEHLQSLFRKKVVHKNKIKDLLEAHFYENQQESEEVEDEMECDLDVDNYKGKEKGKREAPKKEREREASVPQSRFAAIVGENLKLVYLKKSLVYELHKQPESFKDKITGCFVRVKAHPHDIYQRNSHLLMRVTGVKQALHVEKTSDTVLLVSEFPGEISMSKLSDCDFSEEECQNLTGRVKAGLLQKPTLVDLEKKARILHKDITKHWIDKELKLLKNRIDLANEKGWRQDLFEYRERRDLLQTQSELDRLLNNIPTVVPDVEGVESDCNEDNKTDQVDLPAPTNTLTSPGSLPDAEEVNSFFDEGDKTNLGDSQIPCNAQSIPINLPDLEEAKSVCDEDNKIDQGELPAPANTLTCPRSLPEVEMVEPICDGGNKSKLVGSPTPNHTQTSPRSLPGLEVVKFSCDEDNKTDKGESPTPENTWTCNGSLPVQDDALLRKTFQQSTSDEHIKGSCSHAEPQPEKSTPSISSSGTKQNLHACFTGVMSNDKSAGVTDVIDLSSDDESEDRSSRAIDAEAKSENPELYAWHISGPFVEKSKTYSLSLLKKWSEMSPCAKNIRVWKESQTESDAILLGDAIKLAFPRGFMAPRGCKTRTNKCTTEEQERGRSLKRPRGCHPALVIEPSTGHPPPYRQTTLLDPRTIAASTSSISAGTSTRPGVFASTPTDDSQHLSSHADADDPRETRGESGSSDHDIMDTVPETSGRVRGPDRPTSSRSAGGRRIVATCFEGALVGVGVKRFFGNEIRNKVKDLWPHYKDVDQSVKDGIWNAFLDRYEIQGGSVAYARQLWEDSNKKRWRDLLTKGKNNALRTQGVDDPALLLGTPCPNWIQDPAIWEKYVRYWCQDDQRSISQKNRQNRMTPVGGPDGAPSKHSLGSKGLHERLHDEVLRTGKRPSPLNIRLDLNKKKDKATDEPTGEFYNPRLETAFDEYVVLFHEKYGPDLDPLKAPWDKALWMRTQPVRSGLGKGRMLGAGYTSSAEMLMDAGPSEPVPALEDVQRRLSDSEARNKALEASGAEMREKIVGLKNQVAQLNAMFQGYMGLML